MAYRSKMRTKAQLEAAIRKMGPILAYARVQGDQLTAAAADAMIETLKWAGGDNEAGGFARFLESFGENKEKEYAETQDSEGNQARNRTHGRRT